MSTSAALTPVPPTSMPIAELATAGARWCAVVGDCFALVGACFALVGAWFALVGGCFAGIGAFLADFSAAFGSAFTDAFGPADLSDLDFVLAMSAGYGLE